MIRTGDENVTSDLIILGSYCLKYKVVDYEINKCSADCEIKKLHMHERSTSTKDNFPYMTSESTSNTVKSKFDAF